MANIVLRKKVALTAACNLVQACVEVAADDEDWNFVQAAAAECLESSMSGSWLQRDRRIVNQPVTVEILWPSQYPHTVSLSFDSISE